MKDRRDLPILVLAAGAAFGAAVTAIGQHSETTALGYRLAAAQAEGEALAREAARLERAVAGLRAPNAVLVRARTMPGLAGLDHQARVPALPHPAAGPAADGATERRP